MRNLRVLVVPLLVFIALCALAMFHFDIPIIADFDFIWDVLLGAVLGAAFALLPAMSGFPVRRNAQTGIFWGCGFLSLAVIFYQYISQVTGMRIDALTFLASPGTRARIVEGAMLGYSSLTAGRGKI